MPTDTALAELRVFLDRARASASPGRAEAATVAGGQVISLDAVRPAPLVAPRWTLDELSGRLTEVSGQGAVASLTAAVTLVVEAQDRGEPAAWLTLATASFYPPDLAEAGVDLDALVVVRGPEPVVLARAADRLLRSGGFGLVVIDLGPAGAAVELPIAVTGRLLGLAQHHAAALVVITDKPLTTPSLGSMVSLRAEAMRERGADGFRVAVRAHKDKRRGPGWHEVATVRGPAGLR